MISYFLYQASAYLPEPLEHTALRANGWSGRVVAWFLFFCVMFQQNTKRDRSRPSHQGMAAFAVDEDRAELEVLNANLRKTNENSAKITAVLSGLDERLGRLEGTMKPIHRTTKRLWQVQSNVAATIAAIEKTKTYWNIPFEEESTIRAGPSTNLQRFLTSVRNLDQGMVTLQSADLSSSQRIVNKTHELLKSATEQLRDYWQAVLNSGSVPIAPLTYVLKGQAPPAFSSEQAEQMRDMAKVAAESRGLASVQTQQTQSFIEIRSDYIQRSLETFPLASQRSLELRTAALYDREFNGIGHYTEAILQMTRQDRELCLTVFGEQTGLDVYERTVAPAFSDYCRTCKGITAHVKVHLGPDCYLGFEALGHLKRLNATVVDIETPEIARDLHATVTSIATVSAGAFHEMAEDMKRKMGAVLALPIDGGVLDHTKELCSRLRKCCEYPEIVADLLSALGEGGWRRPVTGPVKLPHTETPAAGLLLDNFACECIDANLQILEAKARNLLKRPNQMAIFMLNNVAYVSSTIKRSEMHRYIGKRTLAKLDETHKRIFKVYREACDLPARQLMDTTTMLRPADNKSKGSSMTSKDREAVKERFRLFNAEFEELIRSSKSFTVQDADLKQQLTGEIRAVIVPLYVRFYDKYVAMDFAKNKDKYIKYDKSSIEKVIWDALA
ncbi:Cullin repeat-like-containing domain protein [Protomyces lactucae-debilis]|uniref:Exocyst complex protein EXO70 n=1 Tax=Protomyces lactucae-debilis TaxID=2754530 RepID=A0A1Y2FS82_PROLT|nr:Cullin repeat-like-containing domain protein [Protomyces lactucae-debilis]ORY86853.1 Cullin repeat-like-containing domain protein [Protomyces lactucae-debilis]